MVTRSILRRLQSERKTSTSDRRSAGAEFGCNIPHGTKKEGKSMNFKETMSILKKILAMVDKIYHAVVKDEEDTDEDESEEQEC